MSSSKNSFLSKNWLTMPKPTDYYLVETFENKAKFRIEPLRKGFGITLGNAMRRTMLSSIWGAAVVGVCIDGVEHEYSSIEGVKEDVIDILLNLKSLIIVTDSDERKVLLLDVNGCEQPITVTAGMITLPHGIHIVNKDAVICHMEGRNARIRIEIYVGTNSGYVTSEKNKALLPSNSSYGNIIAVDSIFSPVRRVTYSIESYSTSIDEEYERLFLTIETNGAIAADMAMSLAAKILQEQLRPFMGANIEITHDVEEKPLSFDHRLLMKVENLELSVRSQNCLKNENIVYVGDLVTKTESEMLKTPNFGKKSLTEMKEVMAKMNLHFGMEISGWPPAGNIEELARKFEEGI